MKKGFALLCFAEKRMYWCGTGEALTGREERVFPEKDGVFGVAALGVG